MLTRLFLLAIGLMLVAFGIAYLIAPVTMASLGDLDLPTPLAVIEVRGFYGGQLVGLGGFVLLGAWRSAFGIPALLLVAASLGGTAAGRIVGILSSGSLPPNIIGALILEVLGAAGALLLLDRRGGLGPV